VDRFRLTDEDVPLADALASFYLRGAVDDALYGQVRRDDGFGDPAGFPRVVDVDDGDLAQAFVGGLEAEEVIGEGLGLAAGGAPLDDRVPGHTGPIGVGHGEVEHRAVLAGLDVVAVGEQPPLGQFPARGLTLFAGDPNAGNGAPGGRRGALTGGAAGGTLAASRSLAVHARATRRRRVSLSSPPGAGSDTGDDQPD